jgi:hypothetical protein
MLGPSHIESNEEDQSCHLKKPIVNRLERNLFGCCLSSQHEQTSAIWQSMDFESVQSPAAARSKRLRMSREIISTTDKTNYVLHIPGLGRANTRQHSSQSEFPKASQIHRKSQLEGLRRLGTSEPI